MALPTTHELLIVNGRDENGAVPRGAFLLSLETRAWRAVEGEGPDGLVGCNAVYDEARGRVLVFGGQSLAGLQASSWSYDPELRRFERLAPATSPGPRRDAMVAYDPRSGEILLFGGQTGRTSHARDLWSFDGETWTEVPASNLPSGRRWGASGIDADGHWMIFGGTDERESLSDLWRYDPTTRSFERLELPSTPAPRAGAAHAFVPALDGLVLFGGFDAALFAALTDGWLLRFP